MELAAQRAPKPELFQLFSIVTAISSEIAYTQISGT